MKHSLSGTLTLLTITQEEQFLAYAPKLVACFKNFFGEEPWNEAWYCRSCARNYGFADVPAGLRCCGESVEEYFSDEFVFGLVEEVWKKPSRVICLHLSADLEMLSFYWGWVEGRDTIENFIGHQPICEMPELPQAIRKANNDKYPEKYIFSAESGVISAMRGQKLSQKLFETGVRHLTKAEKEIEAIVCKTRRASPMYHLKKKSGFKEIFQEKASDYVYMMLNGENFHNMISELNLKSSDIP
ncbi:MAG: hypothetical protein ACAI44_12790 [Candidatus Sericytochromatia bacterium]